MTMNFRTLISAALLALAGVGQALAATPGEIVKQRTNAVLTALVEQRDAFKADPAKLDAFIDSQLAAAMDREYSARLVLGQHARTAKPEQIAAFADALTDNLMRRYGTALLDFDPDVDVRVKAETPLQNGKLVRVSSEILRKGGAPVPVDYMFRPAGDDDWKVFDVIVEGVSYVQTYRNQFAEQLRTQTLDQVIQKLKSGEIRAGS